MKTTLKVLVSVTIALLLDSCNNPGANHQKADDTYTSGLTERQIGDGDYVISLPSNYSLKEKEGPDFSVYYFSPTDTAFTPAYTGGLYFGNFPSRFGPPNDSCKTETMNGDILNTAADWTTYECAGEYAVQTIIDSKSGKSWNAKIHAFGHGTSKEEIKKVIGIFSTLKKK